MYAEERQRIILEHALEAGRVEVAALAELLDVTPETVRRDLKRLERLGQIKRVHGGAIPVDRLGFEPALDTRRDAMMAEKERIAKAAIELVPSDGAILLDAGTTTVRLAQLLPDDRELTVVTHAIDIAAALAQKPMLTVIVIGGRLRGRTMATVGQWADRMLDELHVDVAFMATNGVSVERGLTTPDSDEARIKSRAVRAAKRTVLLADHTKVGVDHLVRFAEIEDVDTFVTDTGTDAELVQDFTAAGVQVVSA